MTEPRRRLTLLAVAAAVATLWLAVPPLASSGAPGGAALAAAGPNAAASALDEALVRYLPRWRIPVRMKCPKDAGSASGSYRCLKFRGACAEVCNLRARMTVVLPGPNVGPVVASRDLAEDELVFVAYLILNKPALAAIKRHREKARFRTKLRALSEDGDYDVDRRSFRFKRG